MLRRHKELRRLRIEFSTRGGMFYPHTKDYLAKLYLQSKSGTLFNSMDDLAWGVVSIDDIYHFDHKNRAGLQLADIAAGAFYQGLSEQSGRLGDTRFARILLPRLALNTDGTPWGVGLKFMPNYLRADLSDEQRGIFEMFGAPKKSGRPPVPLTTSR